LKSKAGDLLINLDRLENENEEQFIFRLGQAKDLGQLDMSWDEIADVINREFRADESEYRTESAYRKQYQVVAKFLESKAIKQYESEGTYAQEIRLQKQELQKEKQKLWDERTALRKLLREDARGEVNFDKLEELIRENGKTTLPPIAPIKYNENNNVLFICLSDVHMGLTFCNQFGRYDSDIAKNRMVQYLQEVLKINELYHADTAYVSLIGDLCSGNIHVTTQLENRENVIEQVQKVSELISAFVYELSKHFSNIYINSVAGNHSRIGLKDQVLRGERLDDLIPWYMKAKLEHLDNVEFDDGCNYDPTIATCFVNGKEYLIVHGDVDSYSESGISKLVLMTQTIPAGIFFGHLHHNSYDSIAGVKIIRSGSFCGCGDDYTMSKRITGKPEQVVCVMDENGIKAFCPIELY
jgi:predicted phosphodiesterase